MVRRSEREEDDDEDNDNDDDDSVEKATRAANLAHAERSAALNCAGWHADHHTLSAANQLSAWHTDVCVCESRDVKV